MSSETLVSGSEMLETTPIKVPAVGPSTYLKTFRGLLARDLRVLRRDIGGFLGQTIMQPLLFVFVFAYVFPKIGQNFHIPGGMSFGTLIIPGLLATSALFTGISSVALPLSVEFGATKEIEDRALAPIAVWAVGLEKVMFGAAQSLIAALLVFPLGYWIPATPVSVHIYNWWLLAGVLFMICVTSGALGLLIGSVVKPQQIGLMFGVIVIPLTFLGCVYYPWKALEAVPWLHWSVLINPLVYASEGLRNALTPQIPHMAPAAFLGAGGGIMALLLFGGLRLFVRRVID